ncbi:DMT family transporter [Pseudidiomarina sp. 1APR75-15]|uniref:DMT family transporter n=1 Tax=Pseudidiomarina terrestris TaxID=2820060 RepID=A0ABT8MKF1_9GAMM|nr:MULTISPECIES: DMT family transporter [unclassified Pseudidiomarina]MDN7130426.1 DMT family transporter [Pseudidiomarina sp. 1APR75-15]MEA3588803.1 DMT family transporter [Pseudidiomarina sp. 1APP75-27a]
MTAGPAPLVKNQKRALAFGIAAVGLWSTVATAFKIALTYLSPLHLLFLAALISTLIFFLLLMWQGRFRETMALGRQRWLFYCLQGLLNPFIYYWVLFAAYDQLPAQQAQAINYTWAITMALLAVPMLQQRLSLRELVAMVVAYAGVVLIATGGHWDFSQTNWLGIGLALLSTLLWASYWLINTKNTDAPIPAMFWCFAFGTIALAVAVALDPRPLPWTEWRAWLAAGYVGMFEMGVTFLLWLTAMRTAEKTSQLSMLIFLSPFISLLLIYSILGEVIQVTTVIGLSLICLGLYLQRKST